MIAIGYRYRLARQNIIVTVESERQSGYICRDQQGNACAQPRGDECDAGCGRETHTSHRISGHSAARRPFSRGNGH